MIAAETGALGTRSPLRILGITSALQFIEKEVSPLELPPVPLCFQRHLDDKGVACRDVQHVKGYHQWPASGPHFAAVGCLWLFHVVHPSFCGIAIQDDLRLSDVLVLVLELAADGLLVFVLVLIGVDVQWTQTACM